MAHVPLVPIGRPRAELLDDRSFAENRARLAALEDVLSQRRAEVRAGWGDEYAARR